MSPHSPAKYTFLDWVSHHWDLLYNLALSFQCDLQEMPQALQDSWECSPAFALVSLSQCTPPCWLLRTVSSHFCCPLAYLLRSQRFVTLCQHEKVHSTVAHTFCWGELGWFLWYTSGFCHCGIIVSLLFIKSLSFVILIFGYIFFRIFLLTA